MGNNADLSALTWPDVAADLVVVALGSCEQHGPHLPLSTDTQISAAVAERIVARAGATGIRAVLAPPVPYGASGEHEGFPGTVSIGTDALARVIVELGRSVSNWAARVVLVNGHGGNVDALRSAVPQLRSERRDVAWLPCGVAGGEAAQDLHAGLSETSLMLVSNPVQVHMERAERGDTRPSAHLLPLLRAHGVRAVAPNGVLGDPSAAQQDHGRRLWHAIHTQAWQRIESAEPDAAGMLTMPV
ncbi:MAG: mycofactocin biosynthesis peptidyl-dipeptidase MftE [Beutenbergiaceae bacterium]